MLRDARLHFVLNKYWPTEFINLVCLEEIQCTLHSGTKTDAQCLQSSEIYSAFSVTSRSNRKLVCVV